MKVIINACFGGFGLSVKGVEAYLARKGHPQVWWFTTYRDPETGKLDWTQRVPTDKPEDEYLPMAFTTPTPGADDSAFYAGDLDRADPDLVAVVEDIGEGANGQYAQLRVVEVPDGVEYEIDEYDGNEHVAEKHRTWR